MPEAADVTPVPPNKDKTSESRSIAMLFEPSDMSKSSAVKALSTNDLIAFAEAKVSSLADTLDKSVSNTPD